MGWWWSLKTWRYFRAEILIRILVSGLSGLVFWTLLLVIVIPFLRSLSESGMFGVESWSALFCSCSVFFDSHSYTVYEFIALN